VPVAHACNSNYSGGWWFKASPRPIVQETLSKKYSTQKKKKKKNTQYKKRLAEWL
jgi:hypothetical protein